jgi:phage repressor protein C with HTH and peptisase S24 domain
MTDPQHEIRLWLQEKMAEAGHGVRGQLANFVGVRPDAITRMANTDPDKETREIRGHELQRLEAFFREAAPAADGPGPRIHTVPLMGYLGAGAEVDPDYEQVPPEGLDQIELPFSLNEDLIAFKVRGDSMLPFYKDGAVIVVYREQKKPLEAFFGDEAAVRTSAGKRYIKQIMRGDRGVNLISWNAAPIENVLLEWIGEIFAVLPPAAMKRAGKQGGIQGQLRLKTA